MADAPGRREFVIKDLVVSLPRLKAGGAGTTFLPADDGTPLDPFISPVAAVLVTSEALQAVRDVILKSLKEEADLTDIGRAFSGGADGHPAIEHAIREIGTAVVASAGYTAMGSAVGYPDPNCGGSSVETFPPTLSPIIHTGIEVHRVTELPRIRKQLEATMQTLDRAAEQLQPTGDEVQMVAEHLEAALGALGSR